VDPWRRPTAGWPPTSTQLGCGCLEGGAVDRCGAGCSRSSTGGTSTMPGDDGLGLMMTMALAARARPRDPSQEQSVVLGQANATRRDRFRAWS
jgi:hypothetical protein